MALSASDLPDDPAALKAMVLALSRKAIDVEAEVAELKALNATANERIERLNAILRALERGHFGQRSEKLKAGVLDSEQHAFVFEEIQTGLAEIQAPLEKKAKAGSRPARPRKRFADHLERVEVVIEPSDPEGCEGLEKVLIGEDVNERLDVVPIKFRVIVTRRPKYAYRGRDGVFQAPAPAHLIEGGIATEALLAQIAVAKYADGLPLYRQEAIYARDGVELDRSLMAQWMGRVGFELEPLAEAILAQIKTGERIFADETTLPTLAPGSGKVKTAWLWAYARDDRPYGSSGPPMVAYRFEDSRSGACVARHLAGYRGILQVDGYAAYNRLARPDRANDAVTLAGCWAHLWMPPLLQGLLFAFRQYPRLQSSIRPVVAKRPASPALMVNPQVGSQSRVTSSKPGAPNGFMPAPVRPVLPSCSERSSQPRRRIGRRFYCVLKPYDGAVGRKFRHIEVVPKSRARSCSQRRPLRHWRAAAGEGALTIPNCVLSSA